MKCVFLKVNKKVRKNDVKVIVGKMKTKTYFFKFSLNLGAHLLQSEHNKVSTSKFVKYQLQRISSKTERAFEKMTKFSTKIRPKKTIIRQLIGP